MTPAFIDSIRASLPELPDRKKARFVADFKLTDYDAMVLVGDRALAAYFEAAVAKWLCQKSVIFSSKGLAV